MESRVVPPTPQAELRRSTRKMKTQERYSPAIHYLLLTDSGEIEYYEEALQVKTNDVVFNEQKTYKDLQTERSTPEDDSGVAPEQ